MYLCGWDAVAREDVQVRSTASGLQLVEGQQHGVVLVAVTDGVFGRHNGDVGGGGVGDGVPVAGTQRVLTRMRHHDVVWESRQSAGSHSQVSKRGA